MAELGLQRPAGVETACPVCAGELAPRIDENTHFKRDLEADSLDLYTLVQELEDTYGVAMSDEQAARIQTVGAAVDFVLEHAPDTAGPRP